MIKLSKGYSFFPYVHSIIEAEIRREVCLRCGFLSIDMGKYVFGKGIGHLVGALPEIVSRKGTPELPDQIKKELYDLLDSPEALHTILVGQHKIPHSERILDAEAIEELEFIRKERLEIKDNKLRRKVELTLFWRDIIIPKLAKVFVEMKLPKDAIIKEGWAERDFEEFLDCIPTALCLFTLLFEIDQQYQRPISVHDIYDVWALSLAIPYSDIVVTEKMSASTARRFKLDKICNTCLIHR